MLSPVERYLVSRGRWDEEGFLEGLRGEGGWRGGGRREGFYRRFVGGGGFAVWLKERGEAEMLGGEEA